MRLRAGFTSSIDVGDLPALMAHRALKQAGYEVDTTFYARPELAVEALARGDAEFASGGTHAFWAAIAKGADVFMVVEHAENGSQIVTVPGVSRCEELTGLRLALSSPGSVPTAVGRAYLQRCPGASPQVVSMPGSGDRLAALLAGVVDAAVLQRADVARLHEQEPGRFRVLARLDEEFPNLRFEGVFVNGAFARAHPSAVVDYVRARVEANRRAIERPALLFEEARQWPAMGTLDQALVDGEARAPAWAVDGGLAPGSVPATLAFFVGAGTLPASLTAEQVADRSFLAEALQAIGTEPPGTRMAPRRQP
jgi:ABC-type nitrate/sulfonate/bicarbonate transport system substrate-binding protein